MADQLVIGIDTGGTFTDLVAVDDDGTFRVAKQPSSPDHPEQAVVEVLAKAEIAGSQVRRLVHGTTVATNSIIQRNGANIALLTTSGFEDVPFIQRINRRSEYDLHWLKPKPLVRRRNCVGVRERISARGDILQGLEPAELDRIGVWLDERRRAESIDAIAVCLLFAYLNPVHEQLLAKYLHDHFADIDVSLSHAVAPIWREYERSSTTLADAFVKPMLREYSRHVADALAGAGMKAACFTLKSNGGMTPLARMPERPVDCLLSGLAGGIVGGRFAAAAAGFRDVITLDMGGTSADVGLIIGGEPRYTTEFEIEWGLPVAIPVVEVKTLGAGGGSIAWVDKGDMLNVGPQSAGARPGPACYQLSGREPTVTDANLILGRLNPNYFLGGEVRLDVDRAFQALESLARRLGISTYEAAAAIIDIADENMTNAIRLMTIERGIDPRNFGLVAFGGAGPLHGVAIARKLGIPVVIVPPHPGLVSALGAAISDLRIEKVQTFARRSDDVSDLEIQDRFDSMIDEAQSELRAEGSTTRPRTHLAISLRYYQQNYEQDVDYQPESGLALSLRRFHDLHHQFYGYHFDDQPIECVHLKVSVRDDFGATPATLRAYRNGKPSAPDQQPDRRVWLAPDDSVMAKIIRRPSLHSWQHIPDPVIIEELDSTTFVPKGAKLMVDAADNLIIDVIGAR